jgi:hypothetical protein
MWEEERIFIELLKMPDNRVSIIVGGGSENNGQMEGHEDLSSAINDLTKRVVTDYVKMLKM